MTEPREYTLDETRAMLHKHLWVMIRYWEHEERVPDIGGKLEGLTHSILAALDGCSMGIPCFDVCSTQTPEDAKDHKEHGENWFPNGCLGMLHETFYKNRG